MRKVLRTRTLVHAIVIVDMDELELNSWFVS